MLLRVRHQIRCRFDPPARNLLFVLRLVPRSHEGQHVTTWRVDADLDCSLKAAQDGFGNNTHGFGAPGPLTDLAITATGEVETLDTAGVIRGSAERLPFAVFLRDTASTTPDPDLRAFAEQATARETETLGKLHALLEALHDAIAFDEGRAAAAAAPCFAERRGCAESHAHVFAACARHLGVPSRFVSGYLLREDGANPVLHAWAEAHVERLGWVGFDTVENRCPEERHVRTAIGLDGHGAATVRGTRLDNRQDLLRGAAEA